MSPVLVVDDNEDNRKLLAWILEDEGFPYLEAGTGEAALELVQKVPISMLLLDVNLPGISGDEVARYLRRDYRFAKLPILGVTAHAIPQVLQRLLGAGFDKLLSKPLDEEEVLAWIREHLPARESH